MKRETDTAPALTPDEAFATRASSPGVAAGKVVCTTRASCNTGKSVKISKRAHLSKGKLLKKREALGALTVSHSCKNRVKVLAERLAVCAEYLSLLGLEHRLAGLCTSLVDSSSCCCYGS